MTKLFTHISATPLSGSDPSPPETQLDEIVTALRVSREETHNIRYGGRIRSMPSRGILATAAEQIVTTLFPTHYGSVDLMIDGVDRYVHGTLGHALRSLTRQVQLELALNSDAHNSRSAAEAASLIVSQFARQLPDIRAVLVSDLVAAFESDPAATSYPEVLLGYPGMVAISYHRLAHALFRLGACLTARLISSAAYSATAIDIHPGAEIGPSFFIDHGTGAVIGATAVIGRRVRLHQGVTLGAICTWPIGAGNVASREPRHPIVEDDVIIYAGATIIGHVTIGKGSVIGGNVWLTESVPAGAYVGQVMPGCEDN